MDCRHIGEKRPGRFLSEMRGQVPVERLPGNAPELNPKEGVWKPLKRVELKKLCCDGLGPLKQELRRARERLRPRKEVIRACFRQAGLV